MIQMTLHMYHRCAHCGESSDGRETPFTCERCRVQICAACTAFGYGQVHEDTCKPSPTPRAGVVDTEIQYVCTCGSEPWVRDCTPCLTRKVGKYNCFNCDEPRPATLACADCVNHFVCCTECHARDMARTHNHTLTCGRPTFIRCRHARPILLQPLPCGCTMCIHGKWDRDCHICIAISHERAARAPQQ